MKKQTSLHIATPCHENWNGMQPVDKGRFCAQCSRQVTDFTQMTDAQILTYLSSHRGKMCGRFEESQLNRPLAEITPPKKRSWYIAFSLPLLLFFQKNTAQSGHHNASTPTVMAEQKRTLIGDTIISGSIAPPVPDTITVQGTVRDEQGTPIAYANIIQKNTKRGTITDSVGRFSLQLPVEDSSITLEASYVGYASAEQIIYTKEPVAPLEMSLQLQPFRLGEVVTIGSFAPVRARKTKERSTVTCKKVTVVEKADSAFQKLTASELFTVYPNPVSAGSETKIRISRKGQYELQLLDNNSSLLKHSLATAIEDGDITSFEIPSSLPAGIYYLRVIHTGSRKSYLEKLVIR
ncbi:MAG: carboxypeptidase-like regulatory domain-containing protein [Williamsia sp.]|nr:carboxypeptidase-like regulatory domain-containing protein [Williamsia sp.]